jgi:hypothetical protein
MNGRDRPRPPPTNDARRGADPRNGSGSGPGSGDTSMSRAEKFEDEKKRIIQSCYSKKDNDGTCTWKDPICPFATTKGIPLLPVQGMGTRKPQRRLTPLGRPRCGWSVA